MSQDQCPVDVQSRSVRPEVTMRGIIVIERVSRRSSIIAASTTCNRPESSYLRSVGKVSTLQGCATRRVHLT
jgi:hypothetical protein